MIQDPSDVFFESTRLGVDAASFLGPPGILVSTEFSIIDGTIGLENYGVMQALRMEEGFWFQPGP